MAYKKGKLYIILIVLSRMSFVLRHNDVSSMTLQNVHGAYYRELFKCKNEISLHQMYTDVVEMTAHMSKRTGSHFGGQFIIHPKKCFDWKMYTYFIIISYL